VQAGLRNRVQSISAKDNAIKNPFQKYVNPHHVTVVVFFRNIFSARPRVVWHSHETAAAAIETRESCRTVGSGPKFVRLRPGFSAYFTA